MIQHAFELTHDRVQCRDMIENYAANGGQLRYTVETFYAGTMSVASSVWFHVAPTEALNRDPQPIFKRTHSRDACVAVICSLGICLVGTAAASV